jgi:hypothetical protein
MGRPGKEVEEILGRNRATALGHACGFTARKARFGQWHQTYRTSVSARFRHKCAATPTQRPGRIVAMETTSEEDCGFHAMSGHYST